MDKRETELIRINRMHYPVTVLGPGSRIGIWLQGCSNGCSGCLSKDTWDVESGKLISIGEIVNCCSCFEPYGVDGITISGGEPFEQPESLKLLLSELHSWTDRLDSPVDYLCYSGNPYSVLQHQYPYILSLLDTIIPEPFVVELPGKPLRGSDNQPIINLTELGVSRFAGYDYKSQSQPKKCIQFVFENDGSISFVGIPERGDMEKLAELCKAQGLYLKNVSWD